jgi:short subunit dehydrogenase-like uncharacterized protein
MAKTYGFGGELRWAIGGRSREKLAAVRDGLAEADGRGRELPLIVADGRDASAMTALARSARVVATTVGPYAVHGHELVAACAESGTDSCDLTGEPHFVRATIERHHARARSTGARIVHCCGFDSIPSDLGVLVLQTEAAARFGAACGEVKLFVTKLRGGFSGGTAASGLEMIEEAMRDRSVRRVLADPYSLDPDRGAPGPDGADQRGVRWDADLKSWTAPFIMASINARIVRRSNALLGYRYGKDFRYRESTATRAGFAGLAAAAAMSMGIAGFFALAALPPTRALLRKALPAPGEGPSKGAREAGFFVLKLLGIAPSSGAGGRIAVTVRGHSDPGYGETAKMLAESAVCLAKDAIPTVGGVLTPASSMGLTLVERLRRAGMEFEIEGGAQEGARRERRPASVGLSP